MARRIQRVLALAALLLGEGALSAAAPVGGPVENLPARLGIGDLRDLRAMSGASALPVWYELLTRAEAGDFRQFSGGIRGVLVQKIIETPGHADYLRNEIESLGTTPSEEEARAEAFASLASVGSPEAVGELQRFLSERTGVGKRAADQAAYAAEALARVFDWPMTAGPFGPAEVEEVRERLRRQPLGLARPATTTMVAPRRGRMGEAAVPARVRFDRVAEEPVMAAAADRQTSSRLRDEGVTPAGVKAFTLAVPTPGDHPENFWYAMAGLCGLAAGFLPVAARRLQRRPAR